MIDGRESLLLNFNPLKTGLLQKSAGNLPLFRDVRLKDHAAVMYISSKILIRVVCIFINAYHDSYLWVSLGV